MSNRFDCHIAGHTNQEEDPTPRLMYCHGQVLVWQFALFLKLLKRVYEVTVNIIVHQCYVKDMLTNFS